MRRLAESAIPTLVFADRAEAAGAVAAEIAELVRTSDAAVLGLATGSTPLDAYRELARLHREERLSFARCTTFHLDEFLDLEPDHPQSFRRWIDEHFCAHVDLDPARRHFPDVDARDRGAAGQAFEDRIRAAGGIDLQLLGIGRNGHIAFNEPGSPRDSRTREVELHAWTREDAARGFGGLERVPRRALTMGVATILEARRLRVLAFGARKAEIVRATLRRPVGAELPSTWLRGHPDVRLYLDAEAAAALD